jgi:hypothetical protein
VVGSALRRVALLRRRGSRSKLLFAEVRKVLVYFAGQQNSSYSKSTLGLRSVPNSEEKEDEEEDPPEDNEETEHICDKSPELRILFGSFGKCN